MACRAGKAAVAEVSKEEVVCDKATAIDGEGSEPPDKMLSKEEVLCEEATEIHGKGPKPTDKRLYAALGGLDSAAICLSGGGIRSAAFALGVVQALATHPRSDPSGKGGKHVGTAFRSLLTQFHYLSTVSGGGYTGSWLSAWCLAEKSFLKVWEQLVRRPAGPDTEPQPLSWLRSFSNYPLQKRESLLPIPGP
jgi:hypothetical protein